MDFVTAVKTCFSKYATFTGRASRSEFWWFALFTFAASVILSMVNETLSGIFSLAVLVPSLSVGVRRLHDIGNSGWFMLIWLIPFIGWAIMIYWACQPSGPANQWGEPAVTGPATAALPPGAV